MVDLKPLEIQKPVQQIARRQQGPASLRKNDLILYKRQRFISLITRLRSFLNFMQS